MDILFLIIIASVIAYKYYLILGKKDDHLDKIEEELSKLNIDIHNMTVKETQSSIKDADIILPLTSSNDPKVIEIFNHINKLYPQFNEQFFLTGASKLFELLIKAYAEGNTEVIDTWTTKDLGQSLINDINSRKDKKQILNVTIISILKPSIIDADLDHVSNKAQIHVNFESEQVSILTDDHSKIIQGNPKKVEKINEIWVFEKDLASPGLNWTLGQIKVV